MREENSVKVPHPRSEAPVISMYHSKNIANVFTDFNRVETPWFSISKSKYVSVLRQLKIQLVSPIQLKAHLVSLFRRAYWWSSQTFLMELFLTVDSFWHCIWLHLGLTSTLCYQSIHLLQWRKLIQGASQVSPFDECKKKQNAFKQSWESK